MINFTDVKVPRSVAVASIAMVSSLVILTWHLPDLQHWFIFPLILLALTLVAAAMRWLSGKDDLFDAGGLLAAFGLYFFVFAPILHVVSDFWLPYAMPPNDWRDYLGYAAWLNWFGVIGFLCASRMKGGRALGGNTSYRIKPSVFWPIATALLIASFVAQVGVYAHFGGISAYMNAALDDTNFEGLGVIFLFSESFPIIAFIAFSFWAKRRYHKVPWHLIILALIVFFFAKLMFGGLRGSRSNTIWGIFWATGIVHLYLRPLSRTLIAAGLIFLFGFMVTYSYVKSFGADGLSALTDASLRQSDQRYGGNPIIGVMLVDFSKSDVQSYIIGRQIEGVSDYDLAMGRTYAHALTMLVPFVRPILSLENKRREGTIALYGFGEYYRGKVVSSRLYGLGGEAALNFGILGVPIAYFILGLFVRKYKATLRHVDSEDARLLLMPFAANMFILMIIADSDNLVFYLFKNGAVAIALLLISTRRIVMERME